MNTNYLPEIIHAAYFDVDGTLTKSNIVDPLLYIKKRVMPAFRYKLWKAVLPARFIYWTILDSINRGLSTASIYRQYKGISVVQMTSLQSQCYEEKYKKKLFLQAFEVISSLREKKDIRIVFVSGSLDVFLQPLAAELGAELISSCLEIKNGMYTGEMTGGAVAGERKAEMIKEHARKNQLDLQCCASFGNSTDDIPMLRSVKYPVAINADKGLVAFAQKNNWKSLNWS